jgi:hypothetical protein
VLLTVRLPATLRGTELNRKWIAMACVMLATLSASAQEGKPFEPEFTSVFYFLGASGQLIELERQTVDPISKAGTALFVIPSEKSPVRLKSNEKMQFVVRVTEDFGRATATIQLFRFEKKEGQRKFEVRKSVFMSNKASLKVDTEKFGESSIKVVPSQALAPGEYCISRTTIPQGYCFGVDPAFNP